jgi:hypothetical protein
VGTMSARHAPYRRYQGRFANRPYNALRCSWCEGGDGRPHPPPSLRCGSLRPELADGDVGDKGKHGQREEDPLEGFGSELLATCGACCNLASRSIDGAASFARKRFQQRKVRLARAAPTPPGRVGRGSNPEPQVCAPRGKEPEKRPRAPSRPQSAGRAGSLPDPPARPGCAARPIREADGKHRAARVERGLAFEQILNERGIPTSPQTPEELDRDVAVLSEA